MEMNNTATFFPSHLNRTKGKINPCRECTFQTGRHPGCHDSCEKYQAWKTPDTPIKEEYHHKASNKRNLMKGLSGGRIT